MLNNKIKISNKIIDHNDLYNYYEVYKIIHRIKFYIPNFSNFKLT